MFVEEWSVFAIVALYYSFPALGALASRGLGSLDNLIALVSVSVSYAQYKLNFKVSGSGRVDLITVLSTPCATAVQRWQGIERKREREDIYYSTNENIDVTVMWRGETVPAAQVVLDRRYMYCTVQYIL